MSVFGETRVDVEIGELVVLFVGVCVFMVFASFMIACGMFMVNRDFLLLLLLLLLVELSCC